MISQQLGNDTAAAAPFLFGTFGSINWRNWPSAALQHDNFVVSLLNIGWEFFIKICIKNDLHWRLLNRARNSWTHLRLFLKIVSFLWSAEEQVNLLFQQILRLTSFCIFVQNFYIYFRKRSLCLWRIKDWWYVFFDVNVSHFRRFIGSFFILKRFLRSWTIS